MSPLVCKMVRTEGAPLTAGASRIQVVFENEFFLAYQRSFAYIKIVLNKITVAYIFQIMYVGSKKMETLFYCWWLNYSWISKAPSVFMDMGVQLFLDRRSSFGIPGRTISEAPLVFLDQEEKKKKGENHQFLVLGLF